MNNYISVPVTFHYSASFLPTPRHRKPRTMFVGDCFWIRIEAPSEKEFPVAFIVHDYVSFYKGAKNYNDFSEEKSAGLYVICEEFRVFNDRLYRPVRISHGAAVSSFFEGKEYIAKNLIPRKTREEWYTVDHIREWSEKSKKISDDRDSRIAAIREQAKNYIWFDGKAWKETGEPRYMVNTFGLGHNHGGTSIFIEYGYNENVPASNYFNALHRGEALEYAKRTAMERGDTESVGRLDRLFQEMDINVLMPELVHVEPENQHGSGNVFTDQLESAIRSSGSATEAGILVTALAAAAGIAG